MAGNVDSEFITAIGKLEDRLLILLDLEKYFQLMNLVYWNRQFKSL